MFGAVNALFAGLAFAGIVYAVLLQRQELMLQRRELRLTRQQMAEQTKIQEQRLEMLLAAQQPRLRFVAVVGKVGQAPSDPRTPSVGTLTIELNNDGGPMSHAVGRIWYRGSGEFAHLSPGDQAEDAIVTRTIAPDDVVHDIPRESQCFLHLPCHLWKALSEVEITFKGVLYVRYFNSLSLPRVSEYQIVVWCEKGQIFPIQDVDAAQAARLGFLNEEPLDHYGREDDATIEDLYPELRG